ncbi:C4-dicarboxylate TRAP transporter large permease protein DctM [subsurface metagenome]
MLGYFIIGLELPPVAVIAIIIFVYLILGTFLNVMGMLLLTVPIFFPVILALGFHPIWFGIIVVRASEIAMITPPVGLNVYVVASAIKDIRLEQVFKGILPFLIGDIITLVFLVAFPQISLFLPSLMYVK